MVVAMIGWPFHCLYVKSAIIPRSKSRGFGFSAAVVASPCFVDAGLWSTDVLPEVIEMNKCALSPILAVVLFFILLGGMLAISSIRTEIEVDKCLDAGGSWDHQREQCHD